MMQLFGFWRSAATFRVRIVLNLKGIQIPETMIDIDKGEQFEARFQKLNPMGAVPALILSDGTVLTQSMAIMEWLDEADKVPPLLPPETLARARARALCAITCSDTHPLIVPRVQRMLGAHGLDEPARMAWNTHWFTKGLEAYEAQVGAGPFCCGEAAGIADACLVSHVVVAQRFGLDMAAYPQVQAIAERCLAMPEFARAHPNRQPGAPSA